MPSTDNIMDGRAVAGRLLDRCEQRVRRLIDQAGVTPRLATVMVGTDPASVTYTRMKRKRCERVGMQSVKVELPEETTTQQLVDKIAELGADPSVHGILLQHPTPEHVDERAGFEAIPPAKDVDGVTIHSFGALSFDLPAEKGGFGSCTPAGMMTLLDHYDVPIQGRRAVVVGRSPILGKPMAMMLLARHATLTICHSRTRDLPGVVEQADIVVAAVGRPGFVRGEWIKQGAVVLDAGYNEGNIGDVDFEAAAQRASRITPVPGGVGPMTIATLIEHTAAAAEQQTADHRV